MLEVCLHVLCVCVCVCARACVCACVRVRVLCGHTFLANVGERDVLHVVLERANVHLGVRRRACVRGHVCVRVCV